MLVLRAGLVMTVLAALIVEASSQGQPECSHGDVRLINGTASNEGVVVVCINSRWGTACHDGSWGVNDATVICRQLGYAPTGARSMKRYKEERRRNTVLSKVDCKPTYDLSILECNARHYDHHQDCDRDLAWVECKDDKSVVNVSAHLINPTTTSSSHTVMISWVQNTSSQSYNELTSFEVKCKSEQDTVKVVVSTERNTTQLTGLLPSSHYNCCVSPVYRYIIVTNGTCVLIETPGHIVTTRSPNMLSSNDSSSVNVVGGVLGFIIILLLVLLIISAVALVCLLRPRLKDSAIHGRLSRLVDKRSSTTRNNTSYITQQQTAHVSAASRTPPQVRGSITQSVGDAAPSYSSVGPAYEALDSNRRQLEEEEGANRVNMRERYELSEIHAETDDLNRPQSYEVPVPSNLSGSDGDEYSHLQH